MRISTINITFKPYYNTLSRFFLNFCHTESNRKRTNTSSQPSSYLHGRQWVKEHNTGTNLTNKMMRHARDSGYHGRNNKHE